MPSKIPTIIFLAVSVFFLVPLTFLMLGSLSPDFTLKNLTIRFIVQAFTSNYLGTIMVNTIEFGVTSAAIAVAFAALYAWLIERTDTPGKKFLKLLPIFPLAIPQLVKSIAWIFLFSPTIGLVNSAIETVTGIGPIFNIFTMWGMIFANAAGGIPLAFLMIEASLQSMNPALEDSSRAAGAGALRTFFRVAVPILKPAIIAVFLLEVLIGVEAFDYPLILGRNQIPTLSTTVYKTVEIQNNFSLAASYSDVYLIITIALITLYLFQIRRSYRFVTVTGVATTPTLFRLGKWRWAGFAYCFSGMLVSFILPLAIIIAVSFIPFYTVAPGYNPFNKFTIDNYVSAFQTPLFLEATENSFFLSIGTGVIATLIATVMAYVLVKSRSRFSHVFQYFSLLPIAFPDTVYAVGLIWTFLTIPALNGLYGSIWIILIALVVVWLPYSIRFITNSLIQISDELEEAASITGSVWVRRFPRITLPLLRAGIVNSLVYVMSDSFRELGAVALLAGSSSYTLTVLLLDLYDNQTFLFPTIAALSVLMVIFIATLVTIPRIVLRKRVRS